MTSSFSKKSEAQAPQLPSTIGLAGIVHTPRLPRTNKPFPSRPTSKQMKTQGADAFRYPNAPSIMHAYTLLCFSRAPPSRDSSSEAHHLLEPASNASHASIVSRKAASGNPTNGPRAFEICNALLFAAGLRSIICWVAFVVTTYPLCRPRLSWTTLPII